MKTKLISVFILFVLYALSFIPAAFAQNPIDDPIVYSRCERTQPFDLTADVTINGQVQTVTRHMKGVDIYDVLPDVTNFFSDFAAPCDLIYRDPNGVETIIYNCSSNPAYPGDPADPENNGSCAALDAAVSFDGNTIAFSVFKGKLSYYKGQNIHSQVVHPDAEPGTLGFIDLPNKQLITDGAHLHLYTVSTGEIRLITPFEEDIYDTGPAFISNERIAFTSTRDNHTTTLVWGTNASDKGTRIWTVDIDGKNPDLASHHSLSQEQHPYMLRDGRLAYSSWQIFGGLPFRHDNGTTGSHTTIGNLFHIYAQDPDGAGNFPIYGQHSGDHIPSTFGAIHNAAHFLTQASDGRVWFADYYRGNNKGLGILVGVIPEPEGQEGLHPDLATHHADFYVPDDAINFADWTNNNDDFAEPMVSLGTQSVTHPNYTDPLPFTGKLGHPAALPDNDLMMAWGKGACSTVTNNKIFSKLDREAPPLTGGSGHGTSMNVITSLEMDTPGCDVGIYRATQTPSQHPSDLEMIVDSKEWHEIMARAVVPYSAIFGVDRPEIIENAHLRTTHTELPSGTPFGLFGAASITDRETHPAGGEDGIKFAGLKQFNLQGTDTINYTDDDLCGIRILGVMPNRNRNTVYDIANYAGERIAILGEFPVLNYGTDGNRIIDDSGHPDTSFLVRMPANTPYLTQGVDCNGRTLNTDQTWQSLRPGEQKTCNGCHVHSKPGRTEFETTFAASSEYTIPRLGEGVVPLLTGKSGNTVNTRTVSGYGMRIEYTQDIIPIFEQHCISCHSSTNPAAGLALDKLNYLGTNGETKNDTWWCLVADKSQTCVPPENQTATRTGLTFDRPQLTRYIRAFNSRGSLLYWKAANQRTDNRTDAQDSNDIDFGANHPTTISADELGILSRWIDIGAPGGDETELIDTQKPTLHLALGDGELHVGTVDLGSGIDTSSLAVCVLDSNGGCNNLAGAAQQHGITTVNVGSLGDADTEIYARVKDLANNTTELYRTVGWLQANAIGSGNTGDSQAPNVEISSPAGGSTVFGVISVVVTATDNVGVTNVELFANGQSVGTDDQAPYTFTLDTTTVTDGDYALTAKASDAAGNEGTSSAVNVTVQNDTGGGDTEAPTIFLNELPGTMPYSGIVPVTFETGDNVGVTRVELYINETQLVGTSTESPFDINWDTTQLANGAYTMRARAFDAAGNQKNSNSRHANVDNPVDTEAPAVSIASPTGGTVSGTITVNVNATDNVGVTAVELFTNGQSVGTSNQEPYTFTLDTTTMTDGDYALTAQASDAAGNQGTSSAVNVTVQNDTGGGDTEAPTIFLNELPGTMPYSGVVPVTFETGDNVGVTRVELYINETQLVGTSTESPFTINWDTTQLVNGAYTMRARAFDAAGNQKNSNSRHTNVDNPVDTEAPAVSIASPTGGTVSGTITVNVNATDNVGVTAVELFTNGQSVGTSNQEPYTFTLDTTTMTDGDYALTAQASDAAGNQGISPAVNVAVQNDTGGGDTEAPTIFLNELPSTMPYSGIVPVTFNTSDNVGVARVELYINETQLVGTSTESPFTINWNTTQLVNGAYTMRARAFDAAGNQRNSNSRHANVDNPADTEAPAVNIASPTGGTVSGTISVSVNATDNVGVTAVELFVNGQSLGTDDQVPFNFTLDTTTMVDGNYTLTAQALDAAGNQGTSPAVNVTVENDTGSGGDTEAPTIFMHELPGTMPYSGIVPVTFTTHDHVGVTRVELYINETQLVGTSTESPFTINWDTTQLVNGEYTMRARAFDAAGNQRNSNSRHANVNN